ncbi:hypothetical protein GCM10023155_09540 [Bremerella cremea]
MIVRTHLGIVLASAIALLGSFLPGLLFAADSASTETKEKPRRKDELPFSQLPETFVEERPRNESAENRLQLTTLLTKARLQDHRGDVAGALQTYQRAYRLSPGSANILQEIVRLGFLLQRNEVASRYAVLLAQNQTAMSADALQRVAQYCIEDGQVEQAIELYERALALLIKENAHPQAMGIHFRLMTIYEAHGEPKMAARHANDIARMIEDPKKFDLDEVIEQFTPGGLRSTYEQLGTVYLEAEQPDKAAKMFAAAEKMESNPARHLIHTAAVDVARKDWKGARKAIDKFLEDDDQTDTQPYELLRKIAENQAESPEAARDQVIERLQKLHEASPDFAPLAYYLAGLYAEKQAWDQVIQTASPLVEDEPDASILPALCQAYIEKTDWSAFVTLLATSLDQTYELDVIQEPLDKLLINEAKWSQLQEAIEKLDPAKLSLNERIGVARLYQLDGQGEAAWPWIEAALPDLDSQEKARLLMQFGLQAFRDDQEPVAEKAFRAAIKLGLPKSQTSLFYFYLATTLELQGKTSDALRTAKRAALLDEQSALLRSRIPWTLNHAGRTDEAVEEYRTLLSKFSDDYENRQTRQVIRDAKRLLSSIASQKKEIPEATTWLEEVLDEFPGDTGAMNDLGYLWIDNDLNLGRGFDMIQKAVAEEPDNYAYLDSLGWAYYRLGRFEPAIAQLQKAAELSEGEDGTVLDHLGDVYLAAGQKDKAIEQWQKAVTSLKAAEEEDTATLTAVEAKLKEHQ